MPYDDGRWGPDGQRLQGWLRRTIDVRGRTNTEGFTRPELGVVVARYYSDSADNRSKTFTEYDVFMPRFEVTLRNVMMKHPYIGVDGGQQITLTPANGVPDMTNPEAASQNVADSDGDLVCIIFIGGNLPVIDGCLNHLRVSGGADWQTDSTDGVVNALTYNTTRARVDDDGNIEIDFDDTGSSHDRSLTVNVDGTQFFVIKQDGASGDVRIELGTGAVEKLVLGEAFQTWWDATVQVHYHLDPVSGQTGPPLVAPGNPIGAFPAANLTDKAKVEP